jgi:hypothetical protein
MQLNKFFFSTLFFVFFGITTYSQKIYLEVIQNNESIELIEKTVAPMQIKPIYPRFKSPVNVPPKIAIEKPVEIPIESPKIPQIKIDKKDSIVECKKNKRKSSRKNGIKNQPVVIEKKAEPIIIQESKKEIMPVVEPKIVIEDNYVYDVPTDIDEMPVYKGCEQFFSKQSRVVCMKNKIFDEIFKHIYFPPAAIEKGIEGDIIFEYLIDKEGRALPYAIKLNDMIYKEVIFSAIKKWMAETKEFKTKPAIKNNANVKFSDFVVFSLRLDKGGNANFKTQQDFNPRSADRNRVKIIPTKNN